MFMVAKIKNFGDTLCRRIFPNWSSPFDLSRIYVLKCKCYKWPSATFTER